MNDLNGVKVDRLFCLWPQQTVEFNERNSHLIESSKFTEYLLIATFGQSNPET